MSYAGGTTGTHPLMDDAGIILPIVSDVLEKHDIPYFVGGSAASSVYGPPRTTQDVDFIVDLTPESLPRLSKSFETEFHIDEQAAMEAVLSRDMFNVIHKETMYKADMHILPEGEWGKVQLLRRVWFPMGPGTGSSPIAFASPEDTVLAKLRWYRLTGERSDKQWGDILGVLRQQRARLDRDYLLEWGDRLELSQQLVKALDEAGI